MMSRNCGFDENPNRKWLRALIRYPAAQIGAGFGDRYVVNWHRTGKTGERTITMTQNRPPIAVIGGGVIGLTSAARLLEQGCPVTVYARETTPHTTSDVAGAYWAPGALFGDDRMHTWALAGLAALRQFAGDPASGVRLNWLNELTSHPIETPDLGPALAVAPVAPGRFPAPWAGFRVRVPQVDTPIYMPWLLRHVLRLGGRVQARTIERLDELAGAYPVIVNCTGLGAQALTGDPMFPVRGQVIRVRIPPALSSEMVSAEEPDEITYIIPRSQDCLLGGTYHHGDARTEVDPTIAVAILARCVALAPALADAAVIEHRVGLRPGRRAVRLEAEPLGRGATVIHNYGHGALGHTLAWGCAGAVAALVASL